MRMSSSPRWTASESSPRSGTAICASRRTATTRARTSMPFSGRFGGTATSWRLPSRSRTRQGESGLTLNTPGGAPPFMGRTAVLRSSGVTMQSNPLPTPTQRSGAAVAFAITGLLWTVWLAGILDAVTDGHLYLLLWAGSAVVLWFLLLEELRDPKHSAFAVAVKWWVLTLFGPFGLAYALYVRSTSSAPRAAESHAAAPHAAAAPGHSAPPLTLEARVTFLERRVSELQSTVD